jgi:uncharacterized protein YhbP (UPF0306 family)
VDDALRTQVLTYLDRHAVMTLATEGPEGPWAAAVFYVHHEVEDRLRLYFLSSPTSRHCTNLSASSKVAATIHDDQRDWPEIKGIQLEGRVAPVAEADLVRVRALYGAKFPVVGRIAEAPPSIQVAFAKVRWYVLTPGALYFIDNSAGFGHRGRLI